MSRTYKTSIILLLTLLMSGCLSSVESIRVDQVTKLEEDVGYLLLTIDSEINFSNVRIAGKRYIALRAPDRYNSINYYLVAIPAGDYRIERFGIWTGASYRFDDDEDEGLWGFSVASGVISYVGELQVKRKSYGYSGFELVNHSSQALSYLEKKYPKMLANHKLEYHGPGVDSFFDLVLPNNNAEPKKTISSGGLE